MALIDLERFERLAQAAAGGTSALGIDYSASSKDLVFHLSLGRTFTKQAPLSVPFGASFRLGDVKIDAPQVQFQSDISGGLVFGIRLAAVSGAESEPLTASTPTGSRIRRRPIPSAVNAIISLSADMRPRPSSTPMRTAIGIVKVRTPGKMQRNSLRICPPDPVCRTNNAITRTSCGTKKTKVKTISPSNA